MKKKLVAGLLVTAMATVMTAGCGSDSGSSGDGQESYTIGIEQFAEHGSLANCREGFLKGLEAEGIVEGENLTVDYQNAASDMGTAGQISDSFVSDGVDMICAIATPSAQSAYNAAMDSDIPVVYTAVTDPVEAELTDEDNMPVGNVTGTSDKLPIEMTFRIGAGVRVALRLFTEADLFLCRQHDHLHPERLVTQGLESLPGHGPGDGLGRQIKELLA